MIYDVTLRLYYEYGQATDLGRQVVRVLPRAGARHQRLIASHLQIEPRPVERRASVDFFGNTLTELGFDSFSADLELVMRARVERRYLDDGLDLSPSRDGLALELAMDTHLEPAAPLHYLGNSARIRTGAAFDAYAREAIGTAATVLECVERLGRAIHDDFEFVPGATEADTRAEDAFAARRGVCQDFTHVMISCLRSVGIPAGYVSGFLRTDPPPGQARLEGADAMHAWVRAWCGTDMGWIDYDPTNAIRAGRDHLEVAVGRDYADVSPLRGVTRSSVEGSSGHSVDVIPVGAH
jgi:transglutaminase-like putative cysteine protease